MKMQAYRTWTAGGATSLNGQPKARDATQTFLWVHMKTWALLWKKISPGSFSVNTPLVSFIVNSEQRPASGIVSTPLPGNNRSGFRVDRIFPSVCSYVTSSSSPSLPSASSTFISCFFSFYCYLGWEKPTLESVHTSLCNMFIFCYLFHSAIKQKFQHVFIVLSWVSLSAGSCYDPTNLCIRSFEHNPAGIRVHTFGSWSVCLWEFGDMRIGESADTWKLK